MHEEESLLLSESNEENEEGEKKGGRKEEGKSRRKMERWRKNTGKGKHGRARNNENFSSEQNSLV